MNRVFIADPALKDHRGHHYLLTRVISEACKERGLEPIWLVNRTFTPSPEDSSLATIDACFTADTYDGHRKKHGQRAGAPAKRPGDESIPPETLPLRMYRTLPVRIRHHLTPRLHQWIGPTTFGNRLGIVQSNVPNQPKPVPNSKINTGRLPEQEIHDALVAHRCTRDDTLLFHTSDAHTYRNILNLFISSVQFADWNELPAIHLSTPYDDLVMPHNKDHPKASLSIKRMANLGLIGSRVFLHAENELLAKHLTQLTGSDVSALPIPPYESSINKSKHRTDQWPLNVMYLGAARTEKGFTLLPDLVSSVFEHRPILDVHFHIQVTPQILGYTRDVGVAVSQLRKLGSPRLTLIEEPLSREAYHSTLEKADVLLLMYHPDRYRVRSSGIAVESIISASTIIASKGTFPAELAGCAGIGLDYGESAVNAISAIIRDRDTYRRLAEERRCWYLDNFNARAFVDRLLSPRHRWQPALTTPSTPLRDSTVWKRLL